MLTVQSARARARQVEPATGPFAQLDASTVSRVPEAQRWLVPQVTAAQIVGVAAGVQVMQVKSELLVQVDATAVQSRTQRWSKQLSGEEAMVQPSNAAGCRGQSLAVAQGRPGTPESTPESRG